MAVSNSKYDPSAPGVIERLLQRDRVIVFCALGGVTLLAAIYTIFGVGMTMSAIEMTRMSGPLGRMMDMGAAPGWNLRYAVLAFLMWWLMMIAMMTPSTAPTLLLFAALKRQGPESIRARSLVAVFLMGYLLCWAGFSAVATVLQWALQGAKLFEPGMMIVSSRALSGVILLAAGAYQFSRLKRACLNSCRSPAQFLTTHRGIGYSGALSVGVRHGLYCLGCCWGLMALLFVGGIMNLYWILGLALLVAAEKLLPRKAFVSHITGAGLLIAGCLVLTT